MKVYLPIGKLAKLSQEHFILSTEFHVRMAINRTKEIT